MRSLVSLPALSAVLLVLAVLCCCSSEVRASSANLITNGGFESGDFSGFTLSGNVEATSVIRSNAHSGAWAALLGATGLNVITQTVWLEGGVSYVLSFWLQSLGGTGNFFDLFVSFGNGVTSTVFAGDSLPSGGFVKHTSVIVAPGTGLTSISLNIQDENDLSFFVLDDLSLVAVPNVIQNGGFETGNFSHWKEGGDLLETSVASASDLGIPLSGNWYARLGAELSNNVLSQKVTIEPHASYLLTFYLAGDNLLQESFTLTTQFHGQSEVAQSSFGSYIGSGYQQVVVALPVQSATTTMNVRFYSMDVSGFLDLDDIALVRVDNIHLSAEKMCNGGFEAASFACWTSTFNTDFVFVTGSQGELVPHGGNFFAALGALDDGGANQLQQVVTVQANSTYVLSFWLAVGAENTYINFIEADVGFPQQNFDIYYQAQGLPQGGYTRHAVAVNTPGIGAEFVTMTVTFNSNDNPGYFALDDVSVVPATNLIQNGGFETGNFAHWQVTPHDGSVFVSRADLLWSGVFSAVLGSEHRPVLLSQTVNVAAHTQYSLQFYINGGAFFQTNFLNVTTQFGSETPVTRYSKVNIDPVWNVVDIRLPITTRAGSLKIGFLSQDNPGNLFLDAVSLISLS